MASRLSYSVSVTPIFTHTNSEGPDSDVVAADFGKSFGGSGVVSSLGFGSGGLHDIVAYTGAAHVIVDALPTPTKGLFLRHTGLDETGAATAETVTILVNAAVLCILRGVYSFPTIGCSHYRNDL